MIHSNTMIGDWQFNVGLDRRSFIPAISISERMLRF